MPNRDLKESVGLFNASGVEYLVVGGCALAAHGHSRHTGDIDFWVSSTPENVDRLLVALIEFNESGFGSLNEFNESGFGSLGLTGADFTDDSVIQLGMAPRRIDLLTRIDGVEFDACWARSETMQVDGLPSHFIGLDDFKANKRVVGRMKDLADLDALEPPKAD